MGAMRGFPRRAAWLAVAGVLWTPYLTACDRSPTSIMDERTYEASTMEGWELVVGDGVHAVPGEPAVTIDDLRATHQEDSTRLEANVDDRPVMAHAILVRKIEDPGAMDHVHRFESSFRLPYLPVQGDGDRNAQTIEAAVGVWAGASTRLHTVCGWQWRLNPYNDDYGRVMSWGNPDDEPYGQWLDMSYLEPDQAWHRIVLELHPEEGRCRIVLDGDGFDVGVSRDEKPTSWSHVQTAMAQVEIISIYPGDATSGARHEAHFQDWSWAWDPAGLGSP